MLNWRKVLKLAAFSLVGLAALLCTAAATGTATSSAATSSSESSSASSAPAAPSTPKPTAPYQDNTLEAYGIPDTVIKVILENSLYSDGQSPAQKNQTPSTFTIADVEQLESISLATVGKSDLGTIESSPNADVAKWFASAQPIPDDATQADATPDPSHPYYDIAENAYKQNTTDAVSGPNGSLTTGEIHVDGRVERPAINLLMQIIACAKNASRVQLSGITSLVSPSVAQYIMGLLQTDRLTSLRSLIIDHDQLGDMQVLVSTLPQPNLFGDGSGQVSELDLADNGITTFPWGSNMPLAKNLSELNLAGNDTTLITDTLGNTLQKVLENNGNADLSGASLTDADNYSLNWGMTLINANTGTLKLNDDTVNKIMMSDPTSVTNAAITKYLSTPPQMTRATAEAIYKTTQPNSWGAILNQHITGPQLAALKAYAETDKLPSGNPESITVDDLDFGTIQLAAAQDPDSEFASTNGLTLNATLAPGAKITFSMSKWTSTSAGRPSFDASLTVATNALRQGTTATIKSTDPTSSTFYTNDSAYSSDAVLSNVGVTLKILNGQSTIQPGNYTASIIWNIENAPPAIAK